MERILVRSFRNDQRININSTMVFVLFFIYFFKMHLVWFCCQFIWNTSQQMAWIFLFCLVFELRPLVDYYKQDTEKISNSPNCLSDQIAAGIIRWSIWIVFCLAPATQKCDPDLCNDLTYSAGLLSGSFVSPEQVRRGVTRRSRMLLTYNPKLLHSSRNKPRFAMNCAKALTVCNRFARKKPKVKR